MEKVLLETDAPFLAPQSVRGTRNEPAYLGQLVQTWVKIRGISEDEVARLTTENACRLFKIPPPSHG